MIRALGVFSYVVICTALFVSSAHADPKRNCGSINDAKRYLYEDIEGLTPRAIADDFTEFTLLPLLDEDVRQAWPYLQQARGDIGAAVTVFNASTGNDVLTDSQREDLAALWSVHSTIMTYEGARLHPAQIALLLSLDWNDWRAKLMTREEYVIAFLAETSRRIRDRSITKYAAALETAQVMRNRLDDLHGAAGRRIPAEDPQTLAMWDAYTRSQAARPLINALQKQQRTRQFWNEWLIRRDRTLRCVSREAVQWRSLDAPDPQDVDAAIAIENGKWCRAALDVKWTPHDIDDLLDEDTLTGELQKVYLRVLNACPAARTIRLSASVDSGNAMILPFLVEHGAGKISVKVPDQRPAHLAFAERLAAAGAGDPVAMGDVSFYYESNPALLPNHPAALVWLKQAAEAGESLAQAELARFYAKGIGTYRDIEAALYWANESAEQGDPLGLNQRAYLGFPGSSLERFLQTYEDGSFAAELLRPALDMERAARQCEKKKFRNDARYATSCPHIMASSKALKRPGRSTSSGSQQDFDNAMDTFNQVTLDGLGMNP